MSDFSNSILGNICFSPDQEGEEFLEREAKRSKETAEEDGNSDEGKKVEDGQEQEQSGVEMTSEA